MQYQEIQWQDQFNVGVEVIDNAHRKLFSIMRRLMELTEQKDKSRFACEEGIKFLKNYTLRHFAEEEAYMESISYPRQELHKHIHENFRVKTLPAMEQELEQSEFSDESVRLFTGICLGWLTGHIMMEDHMMSGKLQSKRREEQSLEMLTRLEDTIEDSVRCILGLEIHVISENYAGEKLRDLVLFQKEMETSDGGKLRVVLAFEEKLLLQTAGRMLGVSFARVDGMVLSAAREVAGMITNRVGNLFDVTVQQLLEAQEKRLQEYNLENLFGSRFPLYSLLFDSEKGCIVFCVDKVYS